MKCKTEQKWFKMVGRASEKFRDIQQAVYQSNNLQMKEEMKLLLNSVNYSDPGETFSYVNFLSIQKRIQNSIKHLRWSKQRFLMKKPAN